MEVYRHSGKMPLVGIPLTVLSGIAAASVLGVIYGYATVYDPIVYINMMLTLGFGFAIGKAVSFGVHLGKIRNEWLAGVYGLVFGVAGMYMAWVADLWARLSIQKFGLHAFEPELLWSYVCVFYEKGMWTMTSGHGGGQGRLVSGLELGVIWSVEAAVVVGFATWFAYHEVASTPFCEACNRWTRAEKGVCALLPREAGGAALERLLTGDFDALTEFSRATGREPCFLQLDLARCPACAEANFMSVHSVQNTVDKKGNPKQVKKALRKHLVVAAADVPRIREAGLAAAGPES